MEGKTSLTTAKEIFGPNFIGPQEINKVSHLTNIVVDAEVVELPFSESFLEELKNDFILIYGVSKDQDNQPLTLNNLRDFYGIDPDLNEPCFYNQDWYLKEDFAQKTVLADKWYLIRKKILSETRGVSPDQIKIEINKNERFPKAILAAYTFFLNYILNNGELLWRNDFLWCEDRDHNEDIIYVGRYEDPTGINKKGFNIHRHLNIKTSYGFIPSIEI